jgi:hypothetical protein
MYSNGVIVSALLKWPLDFVRLDGHTVTPTNGTKNAVITNAAVMIWVGN